MGSCMYYLKVRDCKQDVVESIREFILEGCEAEIWWQDHRDYERIKDDPEKTRAKFWDQFTIKFPIISKYLKFIGKYGGDCNNALAGCIDFGTDEDVEDHLDFTEGDEDKNGVVHGELRYSAEVWHFADWGGFAEFLENEFGVRDARWISEEDMNPYDLI